MAETIPGGAYLQGTRWVDAEGHPLSKDQIAAAKALAAKQEEAHTAAEQERTLQEAQRDPVARALLQQQEANKAKKAS